jgi:hypothetical protein
MWKLVALLAVLAATGLAPAAAGAQNLELADLAAALTLPVITGGQQQSPAITLDTVTNGSSRPVLLRVDVISADSAGFGDGGRWQSDSFDCLLTGRETTTFLFVASGTGSTVYVECSTPLATDGPFADNKVRGLRAANGVMFVAAADPATGRTVSQDLIFGDAVVIDIGGGRTFSFGAIPFQAGGGYNNGDKIYSFDGKEYARFPSVLAAQSGGELILFTLDGTTGNPQPPRVALSGLAYGDDGASSDFQLQFDCFDIVASAGGGAAHLVLVPQPVGTPGTDLHDAQFGDGNNSRRRAVHGWSGGRPLAQGRGSLVPFLGDHDPVLNASPF